MGRGRRRGRGRGRQSKDKKDLIEQTEQKELPLDVIRMILTKLPIKSVVRFKSVSKLWYSILSSPRFIFAHLEFPRPSTTQSLFIRSNNKFQILSYENGDQSTKMDNKCVIDWVNEKVDFDVGNEKMALVGTCNGLVCLGSKSGCLFIIWNPITREFYKYKDPEIAKFTREDCRVTWGFGREGVLFNETLYWMGGVPPMIYEFRRKIFSFDLASEMFDMFPHLEVGTPSPYTSNVNNDECFDALLCVVNGCLSKYGRSVKTGEGILTLLKDPGETEEIILPRNLVGSMLYDNLIGFTGANKVFIQYCGSYNAPCLGAIDMTSRPLRHTQLMILEAETKSEVVSYCPSLVSPNVLTIPIDGDSNL
ncbi:putative F-box protein At3g10240 [Silene latifolia]|uniref:putative F-box protein At3g10240 n=1 Tax=Silene latifolia TaxID=37657 RepID=UPI003D785F12